MAPSCGLWLGRWTATCSGGRPQPTRDESVPAIHGKRLAGMKYMETLELLFVVITSTAERHTAEHVN